MTGKLKIWLWISAITAVAGAILLYPIGTAILNSLFILVKAGMLIGLTLLLFMRKKLGFYIWSVFCAGAAIMTIIRWSGTGNVTFLIVASIVVDILMPSIAYVLMKPKIDEFK